MKKVGIVGWRGMVGSVLINRMNEEEDFKYINTHPFLQHHKLVKKLLVLLTQNLFC